MNASDIQSDKSRQTSGLHPVAKAGSSAKSGVALSFSKATGGATAADLRERVDTSRPAAGNFASDAVLRTIHPSHARSGSTSSSNASTKTSTPAATKAQGTPAFSATTAWLFKKSGMQLPRTAAPATRKPPTTAPMQAQPKRMQEAIQRSGAAAASSTPKTASPAPPPQAAAAAPTASAKLLAPDALLGIGSKAERSVIARDLTAGHLTPVEAVRIAGDFNNLETYAEVSRLAVGMLASGSLLQRVLLWNLYLAYAGCGKRANAAEVLNGLFAIDQVVLGLPLSQVLAHYDLGYMKRVEAATAPGEKAPVCIGQMIDKTRANLLAWCNMRGLQRATCPQDVEVDYAALMQDLHGAQSPEAEIETSDTVADGQDDDSGEPMRVDNDALAALMQHLDVTVEAERRAAMAAMAEPDAMSEGASEAISDFEDPDPLQTMLDKFGRG